MEAFLYMANIIERNEGPALIMDGDGMALGYSVNAAEFPNVNEGRYRLFAELYDLWPGPIIPVTNRPGCIAQRLADMVCSPLAFAESGGLAVLFESNYINPAYEQYVHYIRDPVIRKVQEVITKMELEDHIHQYGNLYVTACFYPTKIINMESFSEEVNNTLAKYNLANHVDVNVSCNLDISPAGLGKHRAVEFMEKQNYYQTAFNNNFPNKVVAGDDSESAIPMFDILKTMSRTFRKQVND